MAESGRKNADNRVGIIVELHPSPQNSGISAEPSGPQTIADHDRFGETLRLVTRAKHPPDVRGNAKHGEILRTDGLRFETLRTLCACQINVGWPGNGHLLKDARPCSEIVQFWNRKPNILRPHPLIVGHDLHQPVRVRKRKRTQQNRVHDAKNRRVRAHAQSQGKHRYDGKTGTLPKHPQAVPHILT